MDTLACRISDVAVMDLVAVPANSSYGNGKDLAKSLVRGQGAVEHSMAKISSAAGILHDTKTSQN